jgi:hypothetical protein
MKQWEAALVVLSEADGNRLHFREIAQRIETSGYCYFKTDTPAQSVRVAMTDRCPHKRLFRLISDGEYEIGDSRTAVSLLQRIREEYGEAHPTPGSLLRDEIEKMRSKEERNGAFGHLQATLTDSFDPQEIIDARERVLASIVRRQGQLAFRTSMLSIYDGKCAISDCCVGLVLDAAHIIPYSGPITNHPGNGLLLRTDLHTLFDLGLIAAETETMTLLVADDLTGTCYEQYRGKPIRIPVDPAMRPNRRALDQHRHSTRLA